MTDGETSLICSFGQFARFGLNVNSSRSPGIWPPRRNSITREGRQVECRLAGAARFSAGVELFDAAPSNGGQG